MSPRPGPTAQVAPDSDLREDLAGTGEASSSERAAAVAAACLFAGMSDPSRVAILRHLLLGEHNVAQLTRHLGLAQSTVSQHLACLRGCGLVESRAVGRSSMFRVVDPAAVTEVFAATERLLASTGDRVVLCPNTGAQATQ